MANLFDNDLASLLGKTRLISRNGAMKPRTGILATSPRRYLQDVYQHAMSGSNWISSPLRGSERSHSLEYGADKAQRSSVDGTELQSDPSLSSFLGMEICGPGL